MQRVSIDQGRGRAGFPYDGALRDRHGMHGAIPSCAHHRSGFMLVDAMVAVVIVGLAIPAMMVFLASGSRAQNEAAQTATAIRLAQNIHEFALTLSHAPVTGAAINDLGDLSGKSFGPPADSSGLSLSDSALGNWSQRAEVVDVDPETLLPVLPAAITASMPKQLTVTVKRGTSTVVTQQWLLAPNLEN
jgi:type II secretory pathway pseudopilin PulG